MLTGSEIIALSGILMTGIVAVIGWYFSLIRQKNQFKHENQTRFHADKLKIYSDVLAIIDKMQESIADAQWIYSYNDVLPSEAIKEFNDRFEGNRLLFEKIQPLFFLVSSEKVERHVYDFHFKMAAAIKHMAKLGTNSRRQLGEQKIDEPVTKFVNSIVALKTAMKEDLQPLS